MSQVETQIPVTAKQVLDVTNPVEGQKVDAPTPKLDETVSPKFQALIRRERMAVEKERAASAKEKDIETRLKSMSEREAKLAQFESLKSTQPLKALEMLGLSYQELTQIALADGNITPDIQIKKIEDRFDKFEKSQVEALQRQEEEQKSLNVRKETEALENFKGEITKYLSDNAQRYELIEFEQAQEVVFDTIEEHYERTRKAAVDKTGDPSASGEILTIAQAADKVELYYEQRNEKALTLPKIKALMERQSSKTVAKPTTLASQTQKTPTQQSQAQSTQAPQKTAKMRSDEERIRDAIAFAKNLRPNL